MPKAQYAGELVSKGDIMNNREKVQKFDEVQQHLWKLVYEGNMFQSSMAAVIIRTLKIEGPDGEDPEDA